MADTKGFAKSLGKLPYITKVFFLFALVGIIIKLFFSSPISEDGMTGPAGSALWGYGFVVLSLLGITASAVTLAAKNQGETSTFTVIKNIITTSLPIVLVLVILTWIVIQNITYFTRINEGKVADEYHQFSKISTILIVIQLILLFKYFSDEMGAGAVGAKGTQAQIMQILASQIAYIMYILTILNLTVVGVQQVILQYFSTDG